MAIKEAISLGGLYLSAGQRHGFKDLFMPVRGFPVWLLRVWGWRLFARGAILLSRRTIIEAVPSALRYCRLEG
jgi:hypothetical protein